MKPMRNSSEKLWYGSTALTRLGSRNSTPTSGSQRMRRRAAARTSATNVPSLIQMP